MIFNDAMPRVEYTVSGREGRVYRSLSDQRCAMCGTVILQGAYLTRHTLPVTGTVLLVCADCQPFRLLPMPIDRDVDVLAPS